MATTETKVANIKFNRLTKTQFEENDIQANTINFVDPEFKGNRALVTDVYGDIVESDVTKNEISHLTGVTSPIQRQLNEKLTSNSSLNASNLTGTVPTSSIPVATSTAFGGVKPIPKTDEMTGEVGIDENGKLYFKPSYDTVVFTVTASTQDGVTVTGQTVYLRAGNTIDAPIIQSKEYKGEAITFLVSRGMEYFINISNELADHFNPTTATGFARVDTVVELVYSDVSSTKKLTDIPIVLKMLGTVDNAKKVLVGKEFDDVWVDYDANGNGDAEILNVDGHPAWSDPWVITNVEEVEDEDGNTHVGAVLRRIYGSQYGIPFDAPNTQLCDSAVDVTAEEDLYYYGLTLGATSTTAANLSALSLSGGETIPYADYEKIYKNEYSDSTKNILQYGHNRYETSAIRQYLNSEADKGNWWTQKYVGQVAPSVANSYCGYLQGCSDTIRSLAKPVKRPLVSNDVTTSKAHPTKKELYYIYDQFFLPSANEMFGTGNGLSVEEDGEYQYEFWRKRILGDDYTEEAASTIVPSNDDTSVNGVRTFTCIHNKTATSFSTVRLRSANVSYSQNTWNVNRSVQLSRNTASSGYVCTPACIIY